MKLKYVALALLLFGLQSLSCTGFIAGKNVTEDGSMIFARDEDFGSGVNPKKYVIIESSKYSKGKFFENPDTGFKWPYPSKTLRYSIVPDTDQDYGVWGEVGFNEKGVAVSATVSAAINEKIEQIDPHTEKGVTEPDITSLILMKAKTAREGVEILAEIIDKVGSGESNSLVIADKNEMWYMELYSGHQYAAIKVPDDMYAVIPNAFYLGNIDLESKDVITSKDLINLPKENNLLKEKDGKFHLALTYGDGNKDYDVVRIWAGQNKLSPSNPVEYDLNKTYDLFRKPDKKITVKDVMNVLRDRYEGTEFDANDDKNRGKVRPIGDETNLESHILQIRKDLPSVLWLAMANVEHSVYVPFYENVTTTPKSYSVDNASYNPDSMYWKMKRLNTLAKTNREYVSQGIAKYWDSLENEFILKLKEEDAMMSKLTEKDKSKLANKLSLEKVNKVEKDADKMFNALMYYIGNVTERKGAKKLFEFKK